MHPLLVSAVAGTASNFLDRWARGSGVQPAPQTADFQRVLAEKTAASRPSAAQIALERQGTLRKQLLDAPEIRAALDTSDPTKPASLSLTPDGRVLIAAPGRDAKPILLSPDTAEAARELAQLAASRGPAPFAPAALPRTNAYDLTPPTAITALR